MVTICRNNSNRFRNIRITCKEMMLCHRYRRKPEMMSCLKKVLGNLINNFKLVLRVSMEKVVLRTKRVCRCCSSRLEKLQEKQEEHPNILIRILEMWTTMFQNNTKNNTQNNTQNIINPSSETQFQNQRTWNKYQISDRKSRVLLRIKSQTLFQEPVPLVGNICAIQERCRS